MRILLCFATTLTILACACQPPSQSTWTYQLPGHGTSSTPRFADLNEDGILDIVLGAGTDEHHPASHGVIALNGQNGSLLWHAPSTDQIVGSASFIDIDQDGTPDVIIGGRTRQLYALHGKTGTLLWQYQVEAEDPKRNLARFNFYNTQVIRDVNADGIADILATNGGNVYAEPHSEKDRFPGTLIVLSGADGSIVALDTMPDGKETYFSPMIISLPESGPETIIFGSGGETVSGHLYLTTLADLLAGDIQSAQVLASEENHGFIAPVLCSDMNGDSIPDIVGNSHAGTVFVLDGSNLRQIWQTRFEGVEVSNMPVAGHFTTLARKDLFCILSQGSFPENTGTIQLLIHGENGQVLHADTLGCFGFSSPILIQTDEDPFDEVMYCVNQYPNCGRLFTKNVTELRTADFQGQVSSTVIHSVEGKNLGVTPSVIDLDGDQQPDLVQVVMENFTSIYLQHGLSVLRSSPNFPPQHSPWGTYMGNRYTCEM